MLGAKIVTNVNEIFDSDVVLKVRPPLEEEVKLFGRPNACFGFL